MFQSTLAIVLNVVKCSDKSLIVHLFTKEGGKGSFIVKGVHGKKSALRLSMLQPLSIIEIEMSNRKSRDIQYIKEGKTAFVFEELHFNPAKSAIALFIAEVLLRSLRETEKDEALFDFLHKSIVLLDGCKNGTANFHLIFLVEFSRHLGFYPNVEERQPNAYFDLQNGSFVPARPLHAHYLTPQWAEVIFHLTKMNYSHLPQYRISREQRTEILRWLLDYYRLHVSDFGKLKSLDVLQMLFD
ncbi:MAG: DNA repair protein RecO [Prevotellaceae bacterium]|jgi:DNA repair protein RecO (recombination protein O)|nr:DNA repair protein RecO [Prevotellaceae bacterium]